MNVVLPGRSWNLCVAAFGIGAVLALLLVCQRGQTEEPPGKKPNPFPKPAASTPDEPLAASLSYTRAADYLDRASMTWLREKECASCHTNYPFLMARPMLGDPKAPALVKMRGFFEERVAGWDRSE